MAGGRIIQLLDIYNSLLYSAHLLRYVVLTVMRCLIALLSPRALFSAIHSQSGRPVNIFAHLSIRLLSAPHHRSHTNDASAEPLHFEHPVVQEQVNKEWMTILLGM